MLFNSGGASKFRRACTANVIITNKCLAAPVTRPGFSAIGPPAQRHGGRSLRLNRRPDLLVRLTRSNHVLRVECAKGCWDSGSDPDDAFFHARPKHSDPKVAAEKQLGTAHRGGAAGTGRAIMLHLFNRRCCPIHDRAPKASLTISIHLPLQRVSARTQMDFFEGGCKIGFSPIPKSTGRPIVPAVDRKVMSGALALHITTKLSDEEKLEVLRRLDQFRQWHSLGEKRYCLVCGDLISGRQIQVTGGTRGNGPLRLSCPTEKCNSIPLDWVLPTDEILAKVEKLAEEGRKASALKPAAVTIGNGKTVHTDKRHEHFVSRLRRLAFHLKRHAKAVPSNPCGP